MSFNLATVCLLALFHVVQHSEAVKCQKTWDLNGKDKSFATDLLKAHNDDRDLEAAIPKLQHLVWNAEISKTAQAWAERCVYEHSHTKDVGENIAARGVIQFGKPDLMDDKSAHEGMLTSMASWYDEKKDFTYPNCHQGKACGHYTQIVWADTKSVGCGMAQCENILSGWNGLFVVCQYGPPGNWDKKPPYAISGSSIAETQSDSKIVQTNSGSQTVIDQTNSGQKIINTNSIIDLTNSGSQKVIDQTNAGQRITQTNSGKQKTNIDQANSSRKVIDKKKSGKKVVINSGQKVIDQTISGGQTVIDRTNSGQTVIDQTNVVQKVIPRINTVQKVIDQTTSDDTEIDQTDTDETVIDQTHSKIVPQINTVQKVIDQTNTVQKVIDNSNSGKTVIDNTNTVQKEIDLTNSGQKVIDNTDSGKTVIKQTKTVKKIVPKTLTKIVPKTIGVGKKVISTHTVAKVVPKTNLVLKKIIPTRIVVKKVSKATGNAIRKNVIQTTDVGRKIVSKIVPKTQSVKTVSWKLQSGKQLQCKEV